MALLLLSASAQAAGRRIGVPELEGAAEAAVRRKVTQALQAHGFEPVRASDMQEAMLLSGVTLDSDDGLKTLAQELALSAIVTGEVGPRRAKIVIHDGADGSVLGEASWSGRDPRKLADEVGLTFWKRLGPDVERGHLPAGAKQRRTAPAEPTAASGESAGESASAAESEPGEAPPAKKVKKKRRFRMEEAPPEEAAAPRSLPPGNPWFDLELGGGGLTRSLTFNQNVVVQGSALLHPFTLGLGPIAVAQVVLFPWVTGKVGNFGVEATIEQGIGIPSVTWNGESFGETVHEYAGGFRYRVPFAATDDVFFSLTLGEDAFTFDGPNRSSLPTPDTIYHYTRVGTGMHVTISDGLGVSFGGGYRYIDNRGGTQISEDAFPHLTVAGADANVVARYALTDTVELRAGVAWRRYWYAMHSRVGDPVVAGGAIDQSFAFTAGVAVLLGVGSGATPEGGAEAPPAPPPSSAGAAEVPQGGREGDQGADTAP